MSVDVKINGSIDFSRAVRNPFSKIAKAAKENNGELPPETSKTMMREAIAVLSAEKKKWTK